MKKYHEAVESYRLAADFAERYLGATDLITQNMKQIYENAKNEIQNQINKIDRREQTTKSKSTFYQTKVSQRAKTPNGRNRRSI